MAQPGCAPASSPPPHRRAEQRASAQPVCATLTPAQKYLAPNVQVPPAINPRLPAARLDTALSNPPRGGHQHGASAAAAPLLAQSRRKPTATATANPRSTPTPWGPSPHTPRGGLHPHTPMTPRAQPRVAKPTPGKKAHDASEARSSDSTNQPPNRHVPQLYFRHALSNLPRFEPPAPLDTKKTIRRSIPRRKTNDARWKQQGGVCPSATSGPLAGILGGRERKERATKFQPAQRIRGAHARAPKARRPCPNFVTDARRTTVLHSARQSDPLPPLDEARQTPHEGRNHNVHIGPRPHVTERPRRPVTPARERNRASE